MYIRYYEGMNKRLMKKMNCYKNKKADKMLIFCLLKILYISICLCTIFSELFIPWFYTCDAYQCACNCNQ